MNIKLTIKPIQRSSSTFILLFNSFGQRIPFWIEADYLPVPKQKLIDIRPKFSFTNMIFPLKGFDIANKFRKSSSFYPTCISLFKTINMKYPQFIKSIDFTRSRDNHCVVLDSTEEETINACIQAVKLVLETLITEMYLIGKDIIKEELREVISEQKRLYKEDLENIIENYMTLNLEIKTQEEGEYERGKEKRDKGPSSEAIRRIRKIWSSDYI